jgi:hypothetical protein
MVGGTLAIAGFPLQVAGWLLFSVSGLPSPGPPARSASYCATQRRTAVSTKSIDRLTSLTDNPWSRTIRAASSLKLASNWRRLLVI